MKQYKKSRKKALKKLKKVIDNIDHGDPFHDDGIDVEIHVKKEMIKYITDSL